MKKIFVNGLSALDFIHKVDEIPKNASKYKAIESVISVGGAAHASIAIQRLGGQAYLSSIIGNDEIGQIIKQKVLEENINLEYSISSDIYNSSFSSPDEATRSECGTMPGSVDSTLWTTPATTTKAQP